jgi:membrane protein YqaA with SNARE-associated domain
LLKPFLAILISWGPWGLLLLAALDSIGVPIIGGVDALLIAVSTVEPNRAYLAATCAIAGSLAGSYFLFLIAQKGGHVLLAKHTSHGTGLRLRNWFERYGLLTVFIPALSPVPMPMKIPVFCAGALEVHPRSFLTVVAFARIIRYFTLAYLGQRYGRYTLPFLKAHWVTVLLSVLALCAVAVFALHFTAGDSAPAEVGATGSKQN